MVKTKKEIPPMDIALRFISYQPRSEFEVRNKLTDKEISSEDIEKTINRLYELNYLNDVEFCERFTVNGIEYKNKGSQKLRFELMRKGIDESLINKTLKKDETKILFKEASLRAITKWSAKKGFKSDDLRDKNNRVKALNHLHQKGFTFEECNLAYSELIKNEI